jgi:hypothetical protein
LSASFAPAATAFAPFARERASLQSALGIAPTALATARVAARKADPLLDELQAISAEATRLLKPAPRALHQLARLMVEADTPLVRTRPVLRRLDHTVPAALGLTDDLDKELPRVERALTAPLPVLKELGPRGCDILGWARDWRSFLGYGVQGAGGEIGPLNNLRFELIASGESVGTYQGQTHPGIGANPYPAPCEAGTERAP